MKSVTTYNYYIRVVRLVIQYIDVKSKIENTSEAIR